MELEQKASAPTRVRVRCRGWFKCGTTRCDIYEEVIFLPQDAAQFAPKDPAARFSPKGLYTNESTEGAHSATITINSLTCASSAVRVRFELESTKRKAFLKVGCVYFETQKEQVEQEEMTHDSNEFRLGIPTLVFEKAKQMQN